MTSLPRAFLIVVTSLVLCFAGAAFAQTESGMVSGRVTDTTGAVVAGTQVELQSIDRGTLRKAATNEAGIYVFPGVQPGQYHMTIRKDGFRQVELVGLVVNVQDHLEKNFQLQIGSVSESITVTGGAPLVNTEDASVSTVVDRNFAENLPMNGRSFQTLIDLTPGVVLTAGGGDDSGQFSVNGQRAASNYWMVDGVSANVGSSTLSNGNQLSGTIGTTSVLGGTNSLVSIDAMQEFRIQTSTFAPEFGRTPGAQISIVTRSGGNQFHGSAFDFVRNDFFDAADWFNGYINNPPLPKARERQNDFGGTLSGPLLKNRTFFFFSYEGLRLRLPITALSTVPDLNARNTAVPVLQPFLKAYPFDPKQPDLGNGIAQFDASFTNPATLDAYSLRIDHKIMNRLTVFGRYNYSPSEIRQRGGFSGSTLSTVFDSRITTQTSTAGSTWMISNRTADELRFNYSRTAASSVQVLDSFGGSAPLPSLGFPSPYRAENARLAFDVLSLTNGQFTDGKNVRNVQRQFNIVDTLSIERGTHRLKLGFDYRRLSPEYSPLAYQQDAFFADVPSADGGNLLASIVATAPSATFLFRNLGAFVQDTWRTTPRITITYGIRWDTDFAPSTISGPKLPAVTGYNLSDLSRLALAPPGTPTFRTAYGNIAPRLGVAYQLSQRQNLATVVRGGIGVFYDLATSETANLFESSYPFTFSIVNFGGTFPLDPVSAAPPPVQPPNATNQVILAGFAPNLKLPYAVQWNAALEQGLGRQQVLTVSYIGAAGRRLLESADITSPNANLNEAELVGNTGISSYNALQLQFQRRLGRGLQALVSYAWSHSIDTGSTGSLSNGAPGPNQNVNRGPSSFDIRNALSLGVTYAIPIPQSHFLLNAITHGWSVQSVVQAHSAPPVNVVDGNFGLLSNGFNHGVRPDLIPGIPLYLHGPQYPGGEAINNTLGAMTCADGSPSIGPFCSPPVDANGNPLRQGNLTRNALRGFGLTQWDLGLHRNFPLRESLTLQFRAEMFNILNHPNFAPPDGNISDAQFGLSPSMLGQFLSGTTLGSGGLSPLYQVGGSRSMQFALKLTF